MGKGEWGMSFDRDLFRLPEAVAGQEYVLATYYLETPLELYEAANALAAEQSSGTWRRVGRETDDLREAHGAKVVGIYPVPTEILENNLPTAVEPDRFGGLRRPRYRAAVLRLAFPTVNFGAKLPNLLSAVAGNLFEMGSFTAVRLLDLEFPPAFRRQFTGPRFGVAGTRRLLGVEGRPLVGSIIKPCVGLSPQELAQLAYEGARGGLDFMKDDELLADTEYSPLKERVRAVTAALRRAEEETGEKTMYAFNITDRVDRIRELHDIVVENGGTCVMINVMTAGLSAMRVLAEYTQVPIHCHRDFAAAFTRSQHLGIASVAMTKLYRLAGADQIHVGAVAGKLFGSDEEVLLDARTCLEELPPLAPALPVSSGGQWAGTAPVNRRKLGNLDFLHLAGAGVFAHPDGAAAGARSLRQAWDAVLAGVSLEEYARNHRELARALEHFGEPVT